MTIQQYFDINEIFNPSMFYTGEVIMGNAFPGLDVLSLNAKTKSGESRYLDFLEKSYFYPLSKLLNSNSLAHSFNPVISMTHTDEGTRTTKFSYQSFIMCKISGTLEPERYTQEYLELGSDASLEELSTFLKKIQREERKKYDDVINNGKASQYFPSVFKLYQEHVRQSGPGLTFAAFVSGMHSGAHKTTIATRYLGEFFDREIDVEALVRCFDYDKFCLIAAYSIMEGCKIVEEHSNLVHNPAIFVTKYIEAVDLLRTKDPKYNCSIRVYDDKTGKVKNYTVDEVIEEHRALLARHPEFRRYHISLDRIHELLRMYNYDEEFIANFDPQTKDAEIVMGLLQKIEDNRSLLASWNIIPKGKSDKPEPLPVPTDPHIPLPEQEKIRRMIISKDYLENSSYLFRLEGINEFEGYQGYLYPNGTVIFEKYYDNIKTKKVASGSATYVMNLNNFVEVSKLTKSEIISKISKGEVEGVSRIFHREDMDRWKADVLQAITGSDYSMQVEQYIEELLDTNQVNKKGVKQ